MTDERTPDAEARLRSILESAPNMIIMADRSGQIEFINRAFPPYRLEEIVGTSIYDYVPVPDQERVRACVTHVIATGEVSSYEIRLPASSGGYAFSVHVGPVRCDGAVTGITLVTWDITERVELQARLMASDRLASVGLLAAGVAHEVNNPLTYSLAQLQWACQLAAAPSFAEVDTLRKHLALALEGLERIAVIVRDLRSVTQDEACVSISVDVNRVLDSSLRVAQHEIGTRARVVRDYSDLPPVNIAESRLGQIFVNLIVNAAQSMSSGDSERNELRLSSRTGVDGRVVVDIADTGAGIVPELVDRVFDPFVTTKSPSMGTGLGLYVCRQIGRSLGAEIDIARTGPTGTTFRVTLPAPLRP